MPRTSSVSPRSVVPNGAPGAKKDQLDLFAVCLLTLICVLLGVGQVAMKVANSGISPLLQAGLRSLAAAALLAIFCTLRSIRLRVAPASLVALVVSSLFFAAEFGFLYTGLERTSASRAAVFLYTSPFVVAIGAHFLLPGDRLTWTRTLGLICAFAGVTIVLAGRDTTGTSSLTGDLLCLAGGISWGLLTLATRATNLATERPERVICLQLAISGVLLSLLSLGLGEPGIVNLSPLVMAAFAYTVVFIAFFCFTTTLWMMMRYPTSRVMAFLMLTPVFGVAAGVLLLGEPLTPHLAIGLVVVISGLWLVNRQSAPQ